MLIVVFKRFCKGAAKGDDFLSVTSVRLTIRNSATPTGRIFLKFNIWDFY